MSLLEAILMGVIQGLTEFLPVSSSGHLAIFKNLFGLSDIGLLYDVLLHIGTLLAVFVAYWKDIKKLVVEGVGIIVDSCANVAAFFMNTFGGRRMLYRRVVGTGYRKFVMLIIVATIPTGIIGYVGRDLVEIAGGSMLVIGICLIITSILLFISDYVNDGHKKPKNVTYNNAFVIGMCQGLATLPGISRSGATITACLISGFDRRFAVKFSFIMSIPAILGAMVFELGDLREAAFETTELAYYGIGMLISAVIGYICIKTMLVVVRKKRFRIFAVYCLAMGIIANIIYFLA